MKSLSLLFAFFLAVAFPVQSQLTLQSGESFTYEFGNLPFTGLVSPIVNPMFLQVGGRLDLSNISAPSFVAGDTVTLHIDFFENSLSEVPVTSLTYPGTLPPWPAPFFVSANSWQDLQGAFRISLSSDSTAAVRFDGFQLYAFLPQGRFNAEYSQIVMVPEPSALSLLGICSIIGGLGLLSKRTLASRRPSTTIRE